MYCACVGACVLVYFVGKWKGGHMHGELYRFKFENVYLRVGFEPTTSWILVWRSTNWAIRRSDESSLGCLRYMRFCLSNLITYTYVQAVCAFLGKGRGGTPHMHGHKESYTDLNFKMFDLRVGLEPTTSWILVLRSTNWAIRISDESSLSLKSVFTKVLMQRKQCGLCWSLQVWWRWQL